MKLLFFINNKLDKLNKQKNCFQNIDMKFSYQIYMQNNKKIQ